MDFKERAFEFVFEAMLSSGGDGEGILCCDNWKEAADGFETWLNKNHPNFLKREDREDNVIFCGGQEFVTIAHFDYEVSPKRWVEGYVRTILF